MTDRCPADGELRSLLDADAGKDPRDSVAAHLDSCPDCQQRLLTMAGSERLLPEIGPEVAPATGVSEELLRVMESMRKRNYLATDDLPLSFLDAPTNPAHLGQLGTYQVIEVVGQGAMGIVLRAIDPALNRIVAIKVLHPNLATTATARSRFTREAQAAAAVSHDHVVTIHAVHEHKDLPYLVMQFVEGESLEERIQRSGPLGTTEILRIGMQTAAGLAAAHAQGLVHRDIKPANILLENGVARVKITDFGLAMAVDDARLTQHGTVAGTPEYMSPEQAGGQRVGPSADLFSLGAVMYAMCTGRPPFKGGSSLQVLRSVCDDQPPPMNEARREIPAWLAQVVERLLEKNAQRRYSSAQEVASLLEARLAEHQGDPYRSPSAPYPTGSRWQRRRTVLFVGGCLLALPLIFYWQWPRSPVVPAGHSVTTAQGDAFVVVESGATFTQLFEAVRAAPAGGTVEVHGKGPFESTTVRISGKALTIRGVGDERPTILMTNGTEGLISSDSDLALIGLDLKWSATPQRQFREGMIEFCAIQAAGNSLLMQDCRVTVGSGNGCLGFNGQRLDLEDCYLDSADRAPLVLKLRPSGSCRIHNSVVTGRVAMIFVTQATMQPDRSFRFELSHSTIRGEHLARWMVDRVAMRQRSAADKQFATRVDFAARRSLLDVDGLFLFPPPRTFAPNSATREFPREHFRHFVLWSGESNFFTEPLELSKVLIQRQWVTPPGQQGSLAEWQGLWDSDDDSLLGRVTYLGGEAPTDAEQHQVILWEPPPASQTGYQDLSESL